eukprot:COSAG01_NODE_16616_length_1220_cov_2.443354_3_plen_58_part_01
MALSGGGGGCDAAVRAPGAEVMQISAAHRSEDRPGTPQHSEPAHRLSDILSQPTFSTQ